MQRDDATCASSSSVRATIYVPPVPRRLKIRHPVHHAVRRPPLPRLVTWPVHHDQHLGRSPAGHAPRGRDGPLVTVAVTGARPCSQHQPGQRDGDVLPADAPAAHGARRVRLEPRVDALRVERVPAPGQDAEHLGRVERAQAHRALGRVRPAGARVAEPERRERAPSGAAQSGAAVPLARGGLEPEAGHAAAAFAVLGVDEEEEERQERGGEHAHDHGQGRRQRGWHGRRAHVAAPWSSRLDHGHGQRSNESFVENDLHGLCVRLKHSHRWWRS
jgi:hypothetical protein